MKKEVYSNITKLIKILERHWALFTFIVTGIGVLINGLFRGGAYLYTKAYYDFWGIPLQYISIDYGSILFEFLISIFISIILIAGSSIYYLFFVRIKQGDKNKCWRFILWGASVPFLVTIIFLFYLKLQFSIQDIVKSIIQQPWFFGINILVTTLMLFGLIILSGSVWGMFFKVDFSTNNTQAENEEGINITAKILLVVTIILAITIGIYYEGWLLYNSRWDSINGDTDLDIVEISDKEYVVISQFNELWILKECTSKGNSFKISKNKYVFYNLEGITIVKKDLNSSKKIDSYFTEENLY